MLSLPKPTKFDVCATHMNGARNSTICFGPAPSGPGEGSNGQILQSQPERFLCQTLCAFSQIKDKKHTKRDFKSITWVMPQGDFGALGVPRGGIIFFEHGHVAYKIDGGDEHNRMQEKK